MGKENERKEERNGKRRVGRRMEEGKGGRREQYGQNEQCVVSTEPLAFQLPDHTHMHTDHLQARDVTTAAEEAS